jgi:predicted Zn-dependent protease
MTKTRIQEVDLQHRPYTHPSRAKINWRFDQALKAIANEDLRFAEEILRQLVEGSKESKLFIALARVHSLQGQFDKAEFILQSAVLLDSTKIVQLTLAMAQVKLDLLKFDHARELLLELQNRDQQGIIDLTHDEATLLMNCNARLTHRVRNYSLYKEIIKNK